jgi:hypothetical protein
MYAVVVREVGDADQIDQGGDYVDANVVPRVRQAPGFVSAFWMSDGSGNTLNVIAFATEDAARSALDGARRAPRPPYLRLEGAEIFRILASG